MELVKYLFSLPVDHDIKCFLSESLNQDPLEKFFGCHRQRGATSDNPNVKEFVKNTQALCVINSTRAYVSKGNCRGYKSQPVDIRKENNPLPKRKPLNRKFL